MNALPEQVTIVEVGPRDGLQNETRIISCDKKVALIDALALAGVTYIEAGSFVNPTWVPQMADSAQVIENIKRYSPVTYSALTPNMHGFERALAAGVNEVAVFAAASEEFSQKNINCSIDESLQRFEPLMSAAAAEKIPVRGYVSCVLGCPYEGSIAIDRVVSVCHRLLAMGCREISLGDTIGTGTPGKVQQLLTALTQNIPIEKLAVHFHDTYGQALANIFAALQMGISTIDSAVAGLGGCPYARGASGNVATEDVVYMLNGLGISTGIDLLKLVDAGRTICTELAREPASKVSLALS